MTFLLRQGWICSSSLVLFALCTVFTPCRCFSLHGSGGSLELRRRANPQHDGGDARPPHDELGAEDAHKNEEFLRQLFLKYGDDVGRLSFHGFVELVGSIGLGGHGALPELPDVHEHGEEPGFESDQHHHHVENLEHDDQHDEESVTPGPGEAISLEQPDQDRRPGQAAATEPVKGKANERDRQDGDSSHETAMDSDRAQINQCLSPDNLLGLFDLQTSTGLSQEEFLQMCPVLLQQLDSHVCMQFHINDGDDNDDDDHGLSTQHDSHEETTNGHHDLNATGTETGHQHVPGYIWGYAIAAITLISLTSITCILIVPCMQHYPNVYHRLLSVLVAMAVGTLAGDAMMHLIPHSLGIHIHDDTSTASSSDDDHAHEDIEAEKEHARNAVWKGFFVLVGIFSFFIIEQLMGSCQQARKKKKAKRRKRIRAEKSSSQKPLHPDRDQLSDNQPELPGPEYNMLTGSEAVGEKLCHHCVGVSRMPGDTNKKIIRNSMLLIDDVELNSHLGQAASSHLHEADPEVGSSHHHGHGHSHEAPPKGKTSIATVVWIVVMGDGLHNFCDGLVIGAAFSDSIAGGLSTSIAVMCHEVPHELGDFAVMLKGGMTIKQALCVQLVSSVLAYMGLAIGIAAGNVEALSMWIFALAGGMFIYIALVDLFPELIETLSSRPGRKLQLLFLQGFGTALGVCIMLVIGLQEDWLRQQLGS